MISRKVKLAQQHIYTEGEKGRQERSFRTEDKQP